MIVTPVTLLVYLIADLSFVAHAFVTLPKYFWNEKVMELTANSKFDKLIVVGDRVLIKPKKSQDRTNSGLYLPPGVQEKEQVQTGYIMKVGPGYPIPLPMEEDESWKEKDENVKYVPLQVREGDLAIFLQKGAFEVMYQNEKYFIVPQSSILMVEREDDLFE